MRLQKLDNKESFPTRNYYLHQTHQKRESNLIPEGNHAYEDSIVRIELCLESARDDADLPGVCASEVSYIDYKQQARSRHCMKYKHQSDYNIPRTSHSHPLLLNMLNDIPGKAHIRSHSPTHPMFHAIHLNRHPVPLYTFGNENSHIVLVSAKTV
jgi:hypothetical protein